MLGTDFTSLIRENTKTNSTTLTDATIVLLANVVKEDFAPKLSAAKQDDFQVPALRDLIASSTSREYGYPDDIVNTIQRVEAKFSADSDYVVLDELDINSYHDSHQESVIVSHFSNSRANDADPNRPRFDRRRQSIYIYSGTIVAVEDGLKLFYSAFPQSIVAADLAAAIDLSVAKTSTSVAIPRMFHELWARKISMIWKSTRDKPIPFNELEQVFDRDFENKISDYKIGNTDTSIHASLPDDTRLQGW